MIFVKRKARPNLLLDILSDDFITFLRKNVSKEFIRINESNIFIFSDLDNKEFETTKTLVLKLKNCLGIKRGVTSDYTQSLLGMNSEEKKQYKEKISKRSEFKSVESKRIGSCFCKEYWIHRGFSEEEAILKISEKQKENSKKCSNEKRISNSPRRVEYWIEKGFDLLTAKNKCSEFQKKASPRSTLYWTNLGYSFDEAKLKVSEYQTIDINYFISKYGELEGKERYNSWIYHPNKLTAAQENLKKVVSAYSKVSQELFSQISSIFPKNKFVFATSVYKGENSTSNEYVIKFDDGKWIKLDFVDLESKKIIEFDGVYWHKGNEEKDRIRDLKLKELGFEVLRITDKQYKRDSIGVIKECATFLTKN